MEAIVDIARRTIISTRLINALVHVVFDAFANQENLKHWWGPAGFTSTIHQFNFVAGGEWKFVLHGPDGMDYPNRCEFLTIIENKKIVFLHHLPVHFFTMTLAFEAAGDQTKFSFTMVFENEGEVEKIKDVVVPANEQNFDRLENFIDKTRQHSIKN